MPRYTGTRKRGKHWYFWITADGKPFERRALEYGYPDTAEGARDARLFVQAKQRSGVSPTSGRVTVAEWVQTYIAGHHRIGSSSYYSYTRWLRRYIVSHPIGAIPIGELTRADVAAWQGHLLTTLAAATVAPVRAVLSGALEQAVRDELIVRNVTRLAPAPPVVEREMDVWDIAQIRRWLTATADDDLAALWRLYVTTGLRTQELIGLRWQDLDLRAGVLRVRQGRTRTREGSATLGEPKRGSRRELPLLPDDVTALVRHRDRQTFGRQRGDLVFSRADGSMLVHQTIGRRLHRLCAAAGLPDMTPHQLRHTHGTWLAAQGVPQKTISARLGHRRAASSERYIRATQAMHSEAVGRLAASLEEPEEDASGKDLADAQ